MLRVIKGGLTTIRKALRYRREVRCHQYLSKEFPEVNPYGIRQTVVIDKFKVVYNMIHKNGSSSFAVLWNTILSGAIESPRISLRNLRYVSHLNDTEIPRLKTYHWLLIVRNPYARVLSAFSDKFRRDKITDRHGTFDLTPSGFKDFVQWLEDGNLDKNPHWNLQVSEILLPVSAFTDIIRLENLHSDAPAFFRKVGVPLTNIDLDTVYRRGSTHKTGSDSKLAAFYDDRTQEKIYRLYEADFLKLG